MRKSNAGRKPKPESERKAPVIGYRPNNMDEYNLIHSEARKLGISVSEYSRLHVLAKQGTIKTLSINAPPVDFTEQLRRVGVNLWQTLCALRAHDADRAALEKKLEVLTTRIEKLLDEAYSAYGTARK